MPIHIDVPPVEDENEGIDLMIYHLALASSYFETTPENTDLCKELLRSKLNDHALPAALAWIDCMEAAYPRD